MHKFDAEFAEFFGDPVIRRLLAKDAGEQNLLFALKEEKERLWDLERFRRFKLAIAQNPHLLKGKTVLVLRSGLGLLAVWAARAGAARVICVEDSPVVDFIRERVKTEGLGTIECVRTAPTTRNSVDVIIADWIGYFGLNQSFVYELVRLRDLCLKPGGVVLPDRVRFSAACFADPEGYQQRFGFWDEVHGFAMPSMKGICFGEAAFEHVKPRCLVTRPRVLQTVDLATAAEQELDFSGRAAFELQRGVKAVHGVVLWFDVVFTKCHETVELCTAPFKNPTNISNVKLFFRQPLPAGEDEKLRLSVRVRNSQDNVAQTQVSVNIEAESSRATLAQSFLLK